MKSIFTLILFLFSLLTCMAQERDTFVPQEKAYVHFDSNFYFAGDTIWYKAYVVRADNNRPTDISRILYVELLNEQGYLEERQQLIVDYEGHANGQFVLSDSAWAGYYEVRAYTKWMLNFGYWQVPKQAGVSKTIRNGMSAPEENFTLPPFIENGKWQYYELFGDSYSTYYKQGRTLYEDSERLRYREFGYLFSRVIPVYKKPSADSLYNMKVMPTKVTMGDYKKIYTGKKLDVNFFPEGGHIIYGHECRVGWEALDLEGRRVNAVGVLTEDGKIIADLAATHAGRGSFTFTPRRGKSYDVHFTFDDIKISPSLPKIEKRGCSMQVKWDGDSVCVEIGNEMVDEKSLTLVFLCRGMVIGSAEIDNDSQSQVFAIGRSSLPAGMNQVIVIDEDENIYADRLFFVMHDGMSHSVSVKGLHQYSFKPYEKVSLELMVTDRGKHPVAGQNMSVAVRDATQMDESFCTGNIMTELLLQSELRGFVETPDWYFEDKDELRMRALDELCFVQGWRRYEWKDALHPDSVQLQYEAESKAVIKGQAHTINRTKFQKDPGPIRLYCSLLQKDDDGMFSVNRFKGDVALGSDGTFRIEYQPFYGEALLKLRAKYVSKLSQRAYSKKLHDENIFIRKEFFFPHIPKPFDWFEINKPDVLFDKVQEGSRIDHELFYGKTLKGVTVKSKRAHAKRMRDKPVFSIDAMDYINDMWDMGYFYVFDKLDYGESNHHRLSEDLLHFSSGLFSQEREERDFVLLNWTEDVDEHSYYGLHSNFITYLKHIDIITDDPLRQSPYQIYHLDRQIKGFNFSFAKAKYINITLYDNNNEAPYRFGREYNFKGFNHPAEYYSPDYSKMPLPAVPDHRHTLYWNPNVTTDKDGKARIEFFNNSSCTEMFISAEGLSEDGKVIVY